MVFATVSVLSGYIRNASSLPGTSGPNQFHLSNPESGMDEPRCWEDFWFWFLTSGMNELISR